MTAVRSNDHVNWMNSPSSLAGYVRSSLRSSTVGKLPMFENATVVFARCALDVVHGDPSLRWEPDSRTAVGLYADVADIEETAGQGVLRIGIEADSHGVASVYAKLVSEAAESERLLITVSIALAGPCSNEHGLITVHDRTRRDNPWQEFTHVLIGRGQENRYSYSGVLKAGQLMYRLLQEDYPGLAAQLTGLRESTFTAA